MQITIAGLFLFAAMGVIATPIIESESNGHDARAEAGILITYWGTCTKKNNECKYPNQNKKDTFAKCPSFDNKKCTGDGKSCKFDSVNREITCY